MSPAARTPPHKATLVSNALRTVEARIRAAEVRYERPSHAVNLLAVSKNQPLEAIRLACDAGQAAFGENQAQEASAKILSGLGPQLQWHFIGAVQSNKTSVIAAHFDWLHSLDRVPIAQRLARQRSDSQAPLNICLQVNLMREKNKSGVSVEQLPALAGTVAALPRLRLRGLMTLPPIEVEFERQRLWFRQLRQLVEKLNRHGYAMDTLSMGMSTDLEAAIAEGSTMVRIGSAIFGQRLRSVAQTENRSTEGWG